MRDGNGCQEQYGGGDISYNGNDDVTDVKASLVGIRMIHFSRVLFRLKLCKRRGALSHLMTKQQCLVFSAFPSLPLLLPREMNIRREQGLSV